MTPRERFIWALERKAPPKGRVPHFELEFFLTMEAFGKVHVHHRNYLQWDQMSEKEKNLHRNEIVDIQLLTAQTYEQSALMFYSNPYSHDEFLRSLDIIRNKSGNKYFLMCHGDATYSIPHGNEMVNFSYRLADEPEKVKREADDLVNGAIDRAEKIKKHGGLDGFALCADYCLNTGPFLSPDQFSEFIAPYLHKLTKAYKDMGFYVIKHTDGNIMPILDQLVQTEPHALHSIDPQAGVDIAKVKQMVGDKVCLIGNVHCAMLQTGTEEQVKESVMYCLKHGMPGGGYIFSTSNCIYTGMPLERYELMLKIWREYGNY